MCHTVLISLWKGGRFGPFVERDASLIAVRSKCFDVIVGAVVVIEVKMLKPYDLVKFNPFRQISRDIFEFHAGRKLIANPKFFHRDGSGAEELSTSPSGSSKPIPC